MERSCRCRAPEDPRQTVGGVLGCCGMDRLRASRWLPDLRKDSRFRRLALLGCVFIVILFIALLAAIAVLVTMLKTASLSDRLVEVGDILAGATLVLTIVAALVAVLAYAVATGLPDLKVRVSFPFSSPNVPRFRAVLDSENGDMLSNEFKQVSMTVSVSNESNYSARNPAVIVSLRGMAFLDREVGHAQQQGWTVIRFANTQGITEVQWDGGGDYSIHGKSVRKLPDLWLYRLRKVASWPDPLIKVQLLADGYSKEISIPVEFVIDDEPVFLSNSENHRVDEWL